MTTDALCCPISLEEFRDPRVLPCGHTVDLLSVPPSRSVRACPLCRAPLATTTLEGCPINWVVVSCLGLDVASRAIETRYNEQIGRLVEKIRRRMENRTVVRYHTSDFLRGVREEDRQPVQGRITAALQELGFVVMETKILMAEGCLCTSIREDTFVCVVPK